MVVFFFTAGSFLSQVLTQKAEMIEQRFYFFLQFLQTRYKYGPTNKNSYNFLIITPHK